MANNVLQKCHNNKSYHAEIITEQHTAMIHSDTLIQAVQIATHKLHHRVAQIVKLHQRSYLSIKPPRHTQKRHQAIYSSIHICTLYNT